MIASTASTVIASFVTASSAQVPGGEFFKFLVAKGTLKEADCLFYTANVICGLRHMHEMDIVFRDLVRLES